MGLSTKVGTFTANNLTGPSNQQAVTGVGFTPKILLFLTRSGTSVLDGVTDHITLGFGCAIGTGANDEAACAWNDEDNTGTSNSSRQTINDGCILMTSSTGAITGEGFLVSLDADGFTIEWRTANANIVGYMAIGGTDITSVDLEEISTPTTQSSASYSQPGFEPDALIYFGCLNTAVDTEEGDAEFTLGVADKRAAGAEQGVISQPQAGMLSGSIHVEDGAATSNCNRATSNHGIIDSVTTNGLGGKSDLLQAMVTSWDANGHTTYWEKVDTSARLVYCLSIQGSAIISTRVQQWDQSEFVAGTYGRTVAREPSGEVGFSVGRYVDGSTNTQGKLSIGFTDFTDSYCVAGCSRDNLGTTDCVSGDANRDLIDINTSNNTVSAKVDVAKTGRRVDYTLSAAMQTDQGIAYLSFAPAVATEPSFWCDTFQKRQVSGTGNVSIPTLLDYTAKGVLGYNAGRTNIQASSNIQLSLGSGVSSSKRSAIWVDSNNSKNPSETQNEWLETRLNNSGSQETDIVSFAQRVFTYNEAASNAGHNFWALFGGADLTMDHVIDSANTSDANKSYTTTAEPSGIIVWSQPYTGTGVNAGLSMSVGFSDGTTDRCLSIYDEDNVSPTNTGTQHIAKVVSLLSSAGSQLSQATVDSFNSTDFTLAWTGTDANAYKLSALVFSGVQCEVGTFNTGTADLAEVTVSTGFEPKFILLMSASKATAAGISAEMLFSWMMSDFCCPFMTGFASADNVASSNADDLFTDRGEIHTPLRCYEQDNVQVDLFHLSDVSSSGFKIQHGLGDATAREISYFIVGDAAAGGVQPQMSLLGVGA